MNKNTNSNIDDLIHSLNANRQFVNKYRLEGNWDMYEAHQRFVEKRIKTLHELTNKIM